MSNSKTKHTPRPWIIDRQVNSHGDATISIRGRPENHPTIGPQICIVNETLDFKLNGGNSRLIAAAPDLGAELLHWFNTLGPSFDGPDMERTEQALIKAGLIAKATGGAE